MDAIDRRAALRSIMCAAVTAGFSATLLTGTAKAVPLALEKDLGEKVEDLRDDKEKPQTVQNRRPHHRPDHRPDHRRHRHRRRRRKVCWWRNGRRVCVWRY